MVFSVWSMIGRPRRYEGYLRHKSLRSVFAGENILLKVGADELLLEGVPSFLDHVLL